MWMLSNKIVFTFVVISMMMAATTTLAVQPRVDDDYPDYQKKGAISGNLFTVGAPVIMDLITLWSIKFRHEYPSVRVHVDSDDTAGGVSKFIADQAQLLLIPRRMTGSETRRFYAKYSYKPTVVKVAFDMFVVIVHHENPLEKLTVEQLSAIYSSDACAKNKRLTQWGQLELQRSWQAQPIEVHGRDEVSASDDYFAQQVLCDQKFNGSVKTHKTDSDMLEAVTSSMAAIGYSGFTALTKEVKVLPIAVDGKTKPIEATSENAISGRYPLTRPLFLYVNKQPDKFLPAVMKEFLRLVLSSSGQSLVSQYGYVPLSSEMVRTARISIGGNNR